MKADTADTTTDPAAREQRRATLACNLAYEFTRSAGATVLAAEGICAISEHSEPGKWATEALIDAAARTHNLAERLLGPLEPIGTFLESAKRRRSSNVVNLADFRAAKEEAEA